ncbi:Eukaryotic cytochrome b561 [Musa troglodytarum]|uniref:Eukaryotic cytochrome b561 n=1 Tax=Musa troglodytarum TaxID=320322 RepID=A0A9E7HW24_9LILI|nr:Eukaryotic cytochrome b561 [Musa troglodytarum]
MKRRAQEKSTTSAANRSSPMRALISLMRKNDNVAQRELDDTWNKEPRKNAIVHSSSILKARLVSGDGGDHPIQTRIHGDKVSFRIKDLKRLGGGIFRERSNIELDAYRFQQEKYLEAISTQPKWQSPDMSACCRTPDRSSCAVAKRPHKCVSAPSPSVGSSGPPNTKSTRHHAVSIPRLQPSLPFSSLLTFFFAARKREGDSRRAKATAPSTSRFLLHFHAVLYEEEDSSKELSERIALCLPNHGAGDKFLSWDSYRNRMEDLRNIKRQEYISSSKKKLDSRFV